MTRFSAMARIGAILMFVVVLNAGAAFGQQVTGTILGRVTDTSGSVVPGTTIQVQNPAIGFSRTDTADADGRYLEANLPLGTYSVTVQKQGFQTLVHSGIVVTVGSELTVNAELVIGDVQQHVEVTGEAPAIETSNATLSGLVSQDQLRDLPLNGRSVDSLALLSPGIFVQHNTSLNTTVGLGLHITVNGARPDWNLYLLDGTFTNNVLSGRSSAAGEALGVEGILEFRVLTHSFSAEYGRTAGAVISAVTRSGTNQFHGSVYEFVRNTIFNSQNVFASGVIPPYHRNQFGAAVGGPILKNKLFFFANYEGLRARQSSPVTSTVPDAASIASVAANSPILPYLALYPSPTLILPATDKNGAGNVVTNYSQPFTEDYTMMRLDYRLSDKDSFFGRYVYDPSITSIALAVPTFVTDIGGDDRFLALSETHIFSASTLNEFRFALNRSTPTTLSHPTFSIPASLDFVPGQGFGSITFSVGNNNSASQLSSLGVATSVAQTFTQNIIQESDTVTAVKGAHTIKFGADVERIQLNLTLLGTAPGNFSFSSLATLLTATPSAYQEQAISPTSSPNRGFRRTLFGSFVQDDIRLRPNLTLNLGLRWEFMTNPTEVHGWTSANINITDAKNTLGPPFLAPKLNFAPRVGLAWDPTGSGKTSIRAAGGVYDNQLDARAWFNNAMTNADFLQTYQVSNPPFPNGLGNGVGSALVQDQQIQYNSKEPTVYEWNLEVQRQLVPSLSLRVGYVGSRGIHLPGEVQENTHIPTVGANGIVTFPNSSSAPTINTHFASMATTATGFSSDYHALQVLLDKTLSAGLNFQVSYTYSKAMSNADQVTSGQTLSVPGGVMNPYNLNQDYSLSAYDQRHTLVANGAYQMPWDKWVNGAIAKRVLGGWAVNGIYSYGSGLPVDILSGFNDSNSGDTSYNPDRPNLLPGYSSNPTSGLSQGNTAGNPNCTTNKGPAAGIPLHTPTLWFDPCAFAPTTSPAGALSGTFGNLGRNTVIGPGLSTLDFTIVKTTQLTEKTRLEFRAECFNLMNHPNFGLPNNSIASKPSTANTIVYAGNAGQISTTTVDNRELQLGLKLLF